MPLSKQAELAEAKRNLRRLEQHQQAFKSGIVELSQESQQFAVRTFEKALEEQREHMRRLEGQTR
jgi:hypothetical protein